MRFIFPEYVCGVPGGGVGVGGGGSFMGWDHTTVLNGQLCLNWLLIWGLCALLAQSGYMIPSDWLGLKHELTSFAGLQSPVADRGVMVEGFWCRGQLY